MSDQPQPGQYLSKADALLVSLGYDLDAGNRLLAEAEQRRRQEDDGRQHQIIKETQRERRDTKAAVVELPNFLPTMRTTMSNDEQDRRTLKSARPHLGLIHK